MDREKHGRGTSRGRDGPRGCGVGHLYEVFTIEEESDEGRRGRDCDEREPRDYERDGGL